MQNKIYVGNLPYQTTETDLQQMFEQFGAIETVNVITDMQTGRSKGFGFITFSSADSAKNSLTLDGTEVNGRRLVVNEARPRENNGGGGRRSGGGGSGGGRPRQQRREY